MLSFYEKIISGAYLYFYLIGGKFPDISQPPILNKGQLYLDILTKIQKEKPLWRVIRKELL